jgi:hypothetical protein
MWFLGFTQRSAGAFGLKQRVRRSMDKAEIPEHESDEGRDIGEKLQTLAFKNQLGVALNESREGNYEYTLHQGKPT